MFRAIAAFAVAFTVLFASYSTAAAHPKMGINAPKLGTTFSAKRHKRHHVVRHRTQDAVGIIAQCDDRYCVSGVGGNAHSWRETVPVRRRSHYSHDTATVVGGRPNGCPHAFCGCEASLYKFGRIIPSLNLAWNWVKKFPRTSPAPGMAAARRGHVFVLISHISGSEWLVHDGNSGGHRTREHVRSINGYVIVNPNVQLASRW